MLNDIFSQDANQDPELQARLLIEHVRDPNKADEVEFMGDAIAIWDWAEVAGKTQIQAEIAGVVASQVNSSYGGKRNKEWKSKIEPFASQAKAEGRVKDYAGFLEALIILEFDLNQADRLREEAHQLYIQLGDKAREVKHKYAIANDSLNSGSPHQARQLFLDIYTMSRQANYRKGIGLALLGLGHLLLAQRKYEPACRFLYQAEQILRSISNFAISARDTRREILYAHDVPENQYKAPLSEEEIIAAYQSE